MLGDIAMMRFSLLIIGALLGLLGLLLIGTVYLQAHDLGNGVQGDTWTNGEKVNPATKYKCCGENDCHLALPDGLEQVDGGWRVKMRTYKQEWVMVPDAQVQPSPDGKFWVCEWGGEVRCFFVPMSTDNGRSKIVNILQLTWIIIDAMLQGPYIRQAMAHIL
jgi:hypothetical protein